MYYSKCEMKSNSAPTQEDNEVISSSIIGSRSHYLLKIFTGRDKI